MRVTRLVRVLRLAPAAVMTGGAARAYCWCDGWCGSCVVPV
ncbi:hypothetical protein CU044_1915 [Streptomyces sp. L-9-10]|nr:hypothetical protein CU044_1915 [Streptomyces sp. L-9-10]